MRSAAFLALAVCLGVTQQAFAVSPKAEEAVEIPKLDNTFNVIMRVGDQLKGPDGHVATLGLVIDAKGAPVLDDAGKPQLDDGPDFMSYIRVDGKLYGIVQFETSPAPYYVLELSESEDGHLGAVALQSVNASEWEGSIRPCAGSITPWNTHLGGEETYLNVRHIEEDLKANEIPRGYDGGHMLALMAYKGVYLLQEGTEGEKPMKNAKMYGIEAEFIAPDDADVFFKKVMQEFKPYMYGHNVEIAIKNGKPTFSKVLSLGRSSFEAGYVFPDKKTVYLTDDAKGGGLLKFIADTPSDLSKGEMFAAKIKQTNAAQPGEPLPAALEGDVEWISLGRLDHDILLEQARKPIGEFAFSNIFSAIAVDFDEAANVRSCADPEYKLVFWDRNWECLKLNANTPNVEMLAAGLETRRYISYMGGTTEFNKMEGLTHHQMGDKNQLFLAISYQEKAMTNDTKWSQLTDIKVEENYCGCVYAIDLDQDYSAYKISAEVCGEMITLANEPTCAMDKPSNPDNLGMMHGYPWLVVSEDSSNRHQDLLMMHNIDTKENIAIGAAETTGSEVTAGWFHEMEGSKYSYVTANYQVDVRAPLGYFGPYALEGVKEVTWEPKRLFDDKYMNPYSPFYGETRDAPFDQYGVKAEPPTSNPPSSPAATPDNGASRMGVGSAVFVILASLLALVMQ